MYDFDSVGVGCGISGANIAFCGGVGGVGGGVGSDVGGGVESDVGGAGFGIISVICG